MKQARGRMEGRERPRERTEGRDRPREEWIYGAHSVAAVLDRRPERIREIIIATHVARASDIATKVARANKIAVRELEMRQISELVGAESHQGVAARVPLPDYADLEEILLRPPQVVAVLDGITDPMNLGAIIRTAEALGASGVVVAQDRSAGISAVAHKASAGALEYLPICRVVNISRGLRQLKDAGYWVYGASADAQVSVKKADISGSVALVIGSEGSGIRPGVGKEIDFWIKIPQAGKTLSLNAGVACGILLCEILNRQKI